MHTFLVYDFFSQLEILSMLEMKGWIGLKINETNKSWLREDGVTVTESLKV